MALILEQHCRKCLKKYTGIYNSNNHLCPECFKKEKEDKEKKYFDELDKLTLEERVRKIEKWIYDYINRPLVRDRY